MCCFFVVGYSHFPYLTKHNERGGDQCPFCLTLSFFYFCYSIAGHVPHFFFFSRRSIGPVAVDSR